MNKNFLVNDFKGWETRSYLFLALMVGVQLIAFAINPSNWITLVGGLAGIICVNLIGQVTEVKVLKGIQWLYAFFTWLLIGVAAYILLGFVNDAQQTLDAITFSVSATGMLLMIKRYQSQFVFWLLGNIFSILLWFRAGMHAGGDYAIFVMYCMYTFNSIFGMFNWLKIKNKMEKNR